MGENAKQITDADFESEVLTASGLVLVDFWAEWCGPCRMLGPVLEEIASEMGGKVKVVKVNVDQNPATPTKYGIRSIPTMILFKDGQLVETKVGSIPKQSLLSWLNDKAG
jgi:thioredoxin 1